MKRVLIESPFGRTVEGEKCTPEEYARNTKYVLRAIEDSLRRGEAPFASHALYPLVFDDADAEERRMGMEAGWAWGRKADLVAVYSDYGLTPGMQDGLVLWLGAAMSVEERFIGEND